MKRILKIITSVCCILLCSCSKNEMLNSKREPINEFPAVSSNNNQENHAEENIEPSVLESISAGIKDEKSSYIYNGEKVNIEYQYTAVGSKSVGIMVLCDGIATPFSINNIVGEKLLHIIPNDVNGDTLDIRLSFTPIGENGDTISVEIVDIVEPDFDITSLDLNQSLQPLLRGKKYLVNYISGINISMQEAGLEKEKQICYESDIIEIPEEEIEKNKVINDDGTVSNQLQYFKSDWTVNNDKSLTYSVVQGEKLNVNIRYSGTKGQQILTSFYINNEIFPVFNSCNYSECTVDDKHFTTIKGEIDTGKLEKGRYICYSICGNVENSLTIPTSAFIIEVT